MYKALEVEFIISRQMLIMINGDNKMNMKRDNVRIIRTILDLYGVIILKILTKSRFMFILFSPFIIISIFVYLLEDGSSLCRNMSCKLKGFVVFFKLLTCLLLSRPFRIKIIIISPQFQSKICELLF